MRRRCKFTETDLRRAMRAAAKERVLVQIDLMPDGRISIIPIAADATAAAASNDANEWDEVKP